MTEPETDHVSEIGQGMPDADVDTGSPDRAMDALVEGDRVQQGSVMEDNGQGLTDAQRERIRDRFRAMQRDRLVSLYKATAVLTWSKTVISQVVSGTYRTKGQSSETVDKVLRELDTWMSNLVAASEAPKRSECVDTRVVLEVRAVANTALILGTIGAVYGSAGIGKTLTLRALLSAIPGSMLMTITDSTKSVPQFFRELAYTLKIDASGYRAIMRRTIVDRLRDTKRLMLVDEAHLAEPEVLNAIRQLHDDTGCPVLLCGLPKLARRLVEGRGDDGSGATLYSRVGISRDLEERVRHGDGEPLFTVDDVKRVFGGSSLRIASGAQGWLHALANLPEVGGLRSANNALRLAIHVVNKSRKEVCEVTTDMLLEATRMLHGVEGAKHIDNRIKQRQRVA